MPITYRRPHRRAITSEEVEALGPNRPTVARRRMPGEIGPTFRTFNPPRMSDVRVLRSAPYRYTYVRGHVVRTRQTQRPRALPNEWAHRLNEALRSRRGNVCEVCGSVDNPTDPHQWAHIAQTSLSGEGRGYQARIRDVRDNPEKYALMCRSCHREFDRKLGPVGGSASEHA